jgi:hypothetical protein
VLPVLKVDMDVPEIRDLAAIIFIRGDESEILLILRAEVNFPINRLHSCQAEDVVLDLFNRGDVPIALRGEAVVHRIRIVREPLLQPRVLE